MEFVMNELCVLGDHFGLVIIGCAELAIAAVYAGILLSRRTKNIRTKLALSNLNAELSRDAIGSPKNDGVLQNRKGNDPSEIFDLREYAPGYDVRSIHWKLSGKLDKLVVKEASDPSHYQVVLMPDLGLEELENEKTLQQLNTAIALFASVGEQLIRQCAAFYVAIPARYGLRLSEVRSSREFQDALSQWMSIGLPERSGRESGILSWSIWNSIFQRY